MNLFTHGKMGHYVRLMDEAGADGGDGGGAAAGGGGEQSGGMPEMKSLLGGGDADGSGEQAKPDGEQQKPDGEEGKQADGVPESYQFSAPEGLTFDEALTPELSEICKGLNLNQEQANELVQKLIQLDAGRQITPEQEEQYFVEQAQALHDSWAQQSRELEDIGGQHFEASLKLSNSVMTKFATPEFRELLNYSGIGSHPEFFRFVTAIGKGLADDKLTTGAAGEKPAAMTLTQAMK